MCSSDLEKEMAKRLPVHREKAEQRHGDSSDNKKTGGVWRAGRDMKDRAAEGIAHVDEGDAEKGDMAEPDHPSAPGMITVQPVFSVEKETEHRTRDKTEQDADPGGVKVEHVHTITTAVS